MIEALYSAASGMLTQQQGLDVVANNLANAGTVGYKRDRLDQTDLAYQAFKLPTGNDGNVGLGAAPGSISKEMGQGILTETGKATDIAIQGDGFLKVTRPDGTFAYTRAGNLQIDGEGQMGLPSGELLQPRVRVPAGASDVSIAQDGKVTAVVNGTKTDIGQIQTVTFPNPRGLTPIGGNLFVSTANSGNEDAGNPGTGTRGVLSAGYTEGSNVQIATEMVTMITTQRAFEAAARVVSASDEMWGIANGLRR
ncbi:MAG: flagellar hook-basal body complex protein [Thermoleophilia bacterium]